jgi:biopolymer transport protein ExbB
LAPKNVSAIRTFSLLPTINRRSCIASVAWLIISHRLMHLCVVNQSETNMLLLQAQAKLDIVALLMKGGVVMIPLLLLSLIAIVIIFERIFFFNKQLQTDDKVLRHLIKLIQEGKGTDAAEYCAHQKNAFGRIFVYASTGDVQQASELMEDAANVEMAGMEKSLNYLTIIAGVAPLLGFIGTIAGVITIFFDISQSQDISISVISEGLYQKMVSSAAGLVIGIISFSAYHLFMNQVDGFSARIQDQALKLKAAIIHFKS